jgi:hypothetical protein
MPLFFELEACGFNRTLSLGSFTARFAETADQSRGFPESRLDGS